MDQLKSSIVKTELEHGHCEYIEGSDTYTQKEASVKQVVLKHERSDSMSLDQDTRCMTVTSEDFDDRQTDLENDFSNIVVKKEQNYYEDDIDIIQTEIINDYDNCNDKINCDVSNDSYSSDSTLVLDTKPDIGELSDQMQNYFMENTHNLDVSCNPNVQYPNGHLKAGNNSKIKADKKIDEVSTKGKKKLQDKLVFESTTNILCDEIRNRNELNLVNTHIIPKREINEGESNVSCNPNVQYPNGHLKAGNNSKIKADKKIDEVSTKGKKKLQDKLVFESTTNILCDEIRNRNELNLVNTHIIPKREINEGESSNFWATNDDENNLLVKRLVQLRTTPAELYSCDKCDYNCKLRISLSVHMKTHKSEKSFSCDLCNYKSKLRIGLNLHMKQKHKDAVICDLCSSKFKSIDDLFRHSKIHYGENSYACHLCFFETLDTDNFIQHLRNHAGKKTYVCQHCDQKFIYKTLLNKHMLLHAKGKNSKTSDGNVKSQKLVLNENKSEKNYACNQCLSKFTRKGDLTRHKKSHSSDSPFVCHICEKSFLTNANLQRHILFRTCEKPYYCQLCDLKFCYKMALKRHMWVHTCAQYSYSERAVETQKTTLKTKRVVSGKMIHTCKLCNSKFVLKSHLTRHMKTHSGERAFVCDICGQKFSQKRSLKKHMFIHTGERPFACDTCPYRCTSNIDLTKHKWTHTGEKPYACTYCDFRCNRSYSLITHIRSHTGEKPFSCKLCAYKCTRTSQLVRHMRTHTGEKRFSCDLCDYKCTRHCNLQSHMRIHTGGMLSCDNCSYMTANKACLIIHMKRHNKPNQIADE